jgi:hypothetical protein
MQYGDILEGISLRHSDTRDRYVLEIGEAGKSHRISMDKSASPTLVGPVWEPCPYCAIDENTLRRAVARRLHKPEFFVTWAEIWAVLRDEIRNREADF